MDTLKDFYCSQYDRQYVYKKIGKRYMHSCYIKNKNNYNNISNHTGNTIKHPNHCPKKDCRVCKYDDKEWMKNHSSKFNKDDLLYDVFIV